jgi:hypothetical protein
VAPTFPLVLKEIRIVARDPRSYVLRTSFAFVAGLIVLAGWRAAVARAAYGISDLADVGRDLFAWIVVLQTLLALLAAAALGAASIGGEIRRGTLPLLFIAALHGRHIVRAKGFSAALQALTVLICGTPLMAVCAFLGAAGPLDIAGAAALAGAAAAVGAACGVDASARAPDGSSALLRAIGGLAVYGGFALAIFAATLGFGAVALPFLHVYVALAFFLTPGIPGAELAPWTTLIVSLLFASWRLRRGERLVSRSIHPPALPSETPRDLVGLDAVYRRRRGKGGVWDDAPLLWKELVTRPVARLSLFGRLFSLVALGALVLFGAIQMEPGYFLFLWTVYAGLAVTAGALLFETERAQNQWETLLTTPLGRGAFIRQKLAAGLASPEALCVAALAAVSVLLWGGSAGLWPLFALAGATASFFGFAFLLGAVASLHARSLSAAWGSAAVAVGLLIWGVDSLPFPDLAALGPWSLIGLILEAGRRPGAASDVPFRLLVAVLAQAVLALGLGGLAVRRLRECPARV